MGEADTDTINATRGFELASDAVEGGMGMAGTRPRPLPGEGEPVGEPCAGEEGVMYRQEASPEYICTGLWGYWGEMFSKGRGPATDGLDRGV